jgi:hypothetical protein
MPKKSTIVLTYRRHKLLYIIYKRLWLFCVLHYSKRPFQRCYEIPHTKVHFLKRCFFDRNVDPQLSSFTHSSTHSTPL